MQDTDQATWQLQRGGSMGIDRARLTKDETILTVYTATDGGSRVGLSLTADATDLTRDQALVMGVLLTRFATTGSLRARVDQPDIPEADAVRAFLRAQGFDVAATDREDV